MQIKKVKILQNNMCQVELVDGIICSMANVDGASQVDALREFLNNPKNAANIERSDFEFDNLKSSALNIRLGYLANTDWVIIRFSESKTTIPLDIKTKREKARSEISSIRLVNSRADFEKLVLEKDNYYDIV